MTYLQPPTPPPPPQSPSFKAAITRTPATMLTAGATAVWGLTFVLRAIRPEVPIGAACDAVMTSIVGYYFADKSKGDKAK